MRKLEKIQEKMHVEPRVKSIGEITLNVHSSMCRGFLLISWVTRKLITQRKHFHLPLFNSVKLATDPQWAMQLPVGQLIGEMSRWCIHEASLYLFIVTKYIRQHPTITIAWQIIQRGAAAKRASITD